MKKLLVISLLGFTLTASALAERSPSPFNSIYEISGCIDWSPLTFCTDCHCSTSQAMSTALNCMQNNGAQGYEIHRSYTPSPFGPLNEHWDIYYKYCTLDENGDNPSQNFRNTVTRALQGLFDDQVVVSEKLTDLQGHTRIYVMDLVSGGVIETTWTEDGALVNFHEIDADADDGFNHQLEEGLSFYLLHLPSD